ncbi:SpoIID/LytB domain-containing protein [Paenibacillus sp. SYP-B3998]|uniref:SpoIID/LytB domain-containing protein n=1 Tax=Paenibacillus sp. SYP-B3998 TaxID=2678564 RepID=A0A6G3ZQV7_9BACL|nr:SpoIID/LytB domain-containing protein [Paenibacillus sp. SYP-B3998]NEW04522.1 SpoIID/LytB domain-containing protein [Paenibacillus sp. SYP-B3998]
MKWNKLLKPKTIVFITTAALTLVTLPVLPLNEAHADGVPQQLDQIRVALFIDSTKYSLVEPTITLSSPSGLEIGVRNGGAGTEKTWVSSSDASAIRLSLDQYSVNMLETPDFAVAKALHTKLSTMQPDSYVLSRVKLGKTLYQVQYGSFPTKEAAEIAKVQALKDSTVAALTKSVSPVLSGPLHWSAGVYPTEAAAVQQAGVYAQAGVNADVVLQEDSAGQLTYGVWVGGEATTEQLGAVKQLALGVAPMVPLQAANIKDSYLIRRTDVTASTNGAVSAPHYAAGTAGQKTWIHPKGTGITVKERAERSYRGDMEVSAYHDKLTLVNEVPLEQYLYAVMGSELSAGWPVEALKAQAVAARTYALKQGNKYEIAQVTDTTLDQAYYGMQKEFASGTQAVEATRSEVLKDKNGLISPVFSSNAGGMTADPSEVWGNPVAYLRSVPSPDEGAEKGKANWYRIQLTNGKIGFVHAMYVKDTGVKNKEGAAYFEATEAGVNVRSAPYVDNTGNPSIAQLAAKERVLILGQEKESNAFSWVRGPYSAEELKSKLNTAGVAISGELLSLEISKRGPSGRVTELKANGVVVKVPYPDALRSALGGLPSTRFEIEAAGSYTGTTPSPSSVVLIGAGSTGGNTVSSDSIYVLASSNSQPTAVKKTDLIALGSAGTSKSATSSSSDPSLPQTSGSVQGKQFIFRGTGFGHGLGMSQWGARGYADLGYNYQKILQTYYTGVNITKE